MSIYGQLACYSRKEYTCQPNVSNIGVGGYCLTKDPLLASWSRKNFFSGSKDLEMSVNSVSINDQMSYMLTKDFVKFSVN